ncbi:hypothetical protein Tco_1371330 [Tanacetum coccineum]
MYLTASRLDIMFAICACARDSPFNLEDFSDSDYVGASLDRKSTTGAEYVAATNCYGQNPVFHSKTKNIEIRHYFIKDSYEKRLIQVIKIHTDHNVADLLTKAFDVSSSPPHTNVADEAASTGVDVRHGWAATTVTSLDAGQGSSNINKTSSMPHDSPLPRDRLEADKEIYGAAFTKLIKKVKQLEKTVKTSQARRRAKIVVSDDEEDLEDSSKQGRMIEEIDQDVGVTLVTPTHSQEDQTEDQLGVLSVAKVLTDAAKNVHTYTRRRRAVSTGSGGVSTASRLFSTAEESVSSVGASIPVSTTGTVQEVNKDKGKGIMTESEPEQTKTKLQQRQERAGYEAAVRLQEQLDEEERQRIARVHEEASSFNIEKWEDIQATIEELINQRKRYFVQQRAEERRTKPLTQAQRRTYMSNYIKHMGSHTLQQLKRLSFDELKALFETTMIRVQTFHPIKSEGSKKQKTNEVSGLVQEQPEEEEIELSQEDLQQMMMVVPVEEVYVEALQRYMHDPLTWRLYDICGVHHVSTDRGHDIFMLVEKDYPLIRGLLTLMLCNKLQVDQYLEMADEFLRKIFILANRPR